MAINPESQYAGKITPSSPSYPYGSARNVTVPGDGTGTPWEAALLNDLFGLQQAILTKAAVVPSGTPDNASVSQYFQSLSILFKQSIPATIDIMTSDLSERQAVESYYYETQGDGGAGLWRVTGNNLPAKAGTKDFANGLIYDSIGTEFILSPYNSVINVAQFGADKTGVIDSSLAIQNCIDSPFSVIDFGDNTAEYTVSQTLTGEGGKQYIGYATIKAASNADFETILEFNNKTNIYIGPLTFHANKIDREPILTTRTVGIGLKNCTEYVLDRTSATEVIGSVAIPGVGILLGETGSNGKLISPRLTNCGILGKAADGIFCSHSFTGIISPNVSHCTDTGVVLESCNNSYATDIISDTCGSPCAITNATNSDKRDCYIRGVTAKNWNSAVTGGIQIGNPLGTTVGNLINPSLTGVRLYADTAGGNGNGPAINVRKTGTADTIGLIISDVSIDGATTQGVLANCIAGVIDNVHVKNTGVSCIQLSGDSTATVRDCSGEGSTIGLSAENTSVVRSINNEWRNSGGYGEFSYQTATIDSRWSNVISPGVARYGNDVGATLSVMSDLNGDLLISNPLHAVPAGTALGSVLMHDEQGAPLGYVKLENLV